jgi:hypothetical protein
MAIGQVVIWLSGQLGWSVGFVQFQLPNQPDDQLTN